MLPKQSYEKSQQIVKRTISRSKVGNLELPFINRTINTIPTSHHINNLNISVITSADPRPNLIDKFAWTLIQKDYKQVDDKQIYRQYKQLRQQLYYINDIVAKQLQQINRKIQKKRPNSQASPEKICQIRQKQIQNNLNILDRMKKQYHGLKNKQSTIQPKQSIEMQIQKTQNQIAQMKKKIITLKLKNKNIGLDIINTDQVFLQLAQTQKQWENWMRKKQQYQTKLEKVQKQFQQVLVNLDKINSSSTMANNFMKDQQSTKQSAEQLKKNQQKYSQQKSWYAANKKSFETFQSMRQNKYHQLLKQLQGHVQKNQEMQRKMQEIQYKSVQFIQQIKANQEKQKSLKKNIQALNSDNEFQDNTQLTINQSNPKNFLKRKLQPQKFTTINLPKIQKFDNDKINNIKSSKNKSEASQSKQQQKILNFVKQKIKQQQKAGPQKSIQSQRLKKVLQQKLQVSNDKKQQKNMPQNKKQQKSNKKLNTSQNTISLQTETIQQSKIKDPIKHKSISQKINTSNNLSKINSKQDQYDFKNVQLNSFQIQSISQVKKSDHEQFQNDQIVQQFINNNSFSVQKLTIDLNKIEKNIQKISNSRKQMRKLMHNTQEILQQLLQ